MVRYPVIRATKRLPADTQLNKYRVNSPNVSPAGEALSAGKPMGVTGAHPAGPAVGCPSPGAKRVGSRHIAVGAEIIGCLVVREIGEEPSNNIKKKHNTVA